jgi:hypothetical protein
MSIVLSCGCKFDDWPERYYNVTTEGTTREGQPCLCYKTVCEACAVDAVFAGEVLELHALPAVHRKRLWMSAPKGYNESDRPYEPRTVGALPVPQLTEADVRRIVREELERIEREKQR